jgi:hypothetical protein
MARTIINHEKLAAFLEREIREQRAWIDAHGRDESGYVERYGSREDEDFYGDGGEAIYAADAAHLAKLERQYLELTGRRMQS